MIRAMGLVGLIKTFAKVSALFRDRVIALAMGTGAAADMFFLSFNIINGFRGTLADEPLRASFLPLYAEAGTGRGRWDGVNSVVNAVLLGIGCATVLLILGSPAIVEAMARHIGSRSLLDLAAGLTRILAVSLVFSGAATLGLCMLTAQGRFGVPAALPLIMNCCIIAGTLIFYRTFGSSAVAGGVVAGSICQVAVQLPLLRTLGYRYRPILIWRHPMLKQLVLLAVPVVFMQGLVQVNIIVDTSFAAGLTEGNISYLYYANRVMLFPYDILAMGVSMVAFPALARYAVHHDENGMGNVLNISLRMVVFLGLPAAVGLISLSAPVIRSLFGGGMFGDIAVSGTAGVLVMYAAGIPLFVAVRVIYPVFYSLKDTRTPLMVSAGCLVMNVVFNVILIKPLGAAGLALSSSLAAGLNVTLLLILIVRRLGPGMVRGLGVSLLQALAGAAVTGGTAWAVACRLFASAVDPVKVAGAIGAGAIAYITMMKLLRSKDLAIVTGAFTAS